jgi:hypothetical protein
MDEAESWTTLSRESVESGIEDSLRGPTEAWYIQIVVNAVLFIRRLSHLQQETYGGAWEKWSTFSQQRVSICEARYGATTRTFLWPATQIVDAMALVASVLFW